MDAKSVVIAIEYVRCKLEVEGRTNEWVKNFMHLGISISSDC